MGAGERGDGELAIGREGGAPPSARRIDPAGWAAAALCGGAAAGAFALAALWRPLPGLPEPPGPLVEHAAAWAKAALGLALPREFGGAWESYARWLSALPGEARRSVEWRCAAAAAFALLPGALAWRSFMRPRDGLLHVRGGRRHGRPDAAKLLRARMSRASRSTPGPDLAPGVPYPSSMWTRHVLMMGGTGSGKSTVIKPLVDRIVAAGEPLLLFDPKGDFTARWGSMAILAPWDARSLAWDIARDVRGLGEARRFAEALVVGGGNDPMWANAARQIVVGLLLRLKFERGDDWGWAELANLLSAPQPDIALMMAESHPEALRAVEKASVTTQGVLINLASFCAPVFDLARAWGEHPPERRVALSDWALGLTPHRQIILQGHESYAELARCHVRGAIEAVSSVVASVEMEDDPRRALWIVADEFPLMGKVPIRSLFAVGRSRGVRCVLACQDFAQIEEIHGDKLARSMASMCGTLIVGQTQQGETARSLSQAIGSRDVERRTVSSTAGAGPGSSTAGWAREDLALYKPSELGSRLGPTPDGEGVVCAVVVGGDAYELFWPMSPPRRERPQHIPAAWMSGAASAARAASEAARGAGGARVAKDSQEESTDMDLGVEVAVDEGCDARDESPDAPSLADGGAVSGAR